MKTYISVDNFYTKGLIGDEAITTGVVKGLEFEIIDEKEEIIYLKNISTDTIILVTKAMLFSPLFLERDQNNGK